MENKIIFFGDSLVAGYGLQNPSTESIPALISEKLKQQGLNYEVINAGISGDTTSSALSRLDEVLKEKPGIFILELGANDFLRGISPLLILTNLQNIISRVKLACPGAAILLLGIELPDWATGLHQGDYTEIFSALAHKNNIELVPSFLKNVAGIRSLNMPDGVHPLKEGYAIAAENIWPVLYGVIQSRQK
ncbi:arylesterase [Pedobacter miscanthi]|uniref:Arylesterase n=1 Tax=Pedobacter miscanthi TaxID=2259170 RepID=A0A366LDF0_9SPHI|nr:arylesterase [Pedobacter miscanthi]RBQ11519.1 arylesterase [Pedobacter miscanthi]